QRPGRRLLRAEASASPRTQEAGKENHRPDDDADPRDSCAHGTFSPSNQADPRASKLTLGRRLPGLACKRIRPIGRPGNEAVLSRVIKPGRQPPVPSLEPPAG